jgi:hypothetical protein
MIPDEDMRIRSMSLTVFVVMFVLGYFSMIRFGQVVERAAGTSLFWGIGWFLIVFSKTNSAIDRYSAMTSILGLAIVILVPTVLLLGANI